MAFDYSLPEVGDFMPGMKQLGDSLTEVMRKKQQQQQFEQTQVFQREQEERRLKQEQDQNNYMRRIEDRKDRMAQLDFNRRQQMDEDARMDKARKAASPQEAEAIVKGIVRYDPATGKEIGRGKLTPGDVPDVGPAPQTPTAPVAPAFPAQQAASVIPDIAQALPGMPPELAAAMRGKKRLADFSLDEKNPQSDPQAVARMQAERAQYAATADQRKGKMFVDQINDDGIATLLDDQGEKIHVRAKKGWQEGALIGPDGQIVPGASAEGTMRRFDPSIQGARFEDNAAPDRFQTAADAYSNFQAEQRALPGKQKDYAQEMQALPGRQAEFAQKTRDAEGRRPYTMSVGDQPGVTFDFQTQRRAGRDLAAEEFLASLPPGLSERDRNAAMLVQSGIKSGTIEPTKAGVIFQKERLGIATEEGKNTRNAATNATTIKAAEIRANAPGMDWKETVGRGNLALSAEKAGNEQFQKYLDKAGYKADFSTMKDLIDTHENLKAHNSALDVTAGAQFAKKAQGAGVLTDKDYDRFWAAIGTGEERTADWFDRVITGKMGDGKRRIVIEAIRLKIEEDETRIRNMAVQADKKFANEPWYPGTRETYFGIVPDLPPMGQAMGPRIGTSGVPKGAPPEHRKHLKAKGAAVDKLLNQEDPGGG